MTQPVLAAQDVGKYFRRYPSRLAQTVELLTGHRMHEPNWVFRHLSFTVAPGEAVGVIGRNGAGKSTLLRLLSGLQAPSEGTIERRGAVAAILELGVGLHPDFTGRENARQMALVQGVEPSDLERVLPAIESFAEIGRYFDEPVHTYSSGMQMRLAFSVATVFEPDVLIVDEALAVGDAYFQHKCYERIRTMREAGAAVLLVSHDPSAVRSLCSRALLIHDGRIADEGSPASVLETYNALLAPGGHLPEPVNDDEGRRVGSGEVRIASVEFTQHGQRTRSPVSGVPTRLRVRLDVNEPVDDFTLGILIRDRLGNDVFGTNTSHHQAALQAVEASTIDVEWNIRGFHLGPGHYSLTVAAHRGATHQVGNYDWWDRCLTFQVLPGAGPLSIGPCALDLDVRVHEMRERVQ
ncbi:MAG TPA: ABC transporter ATP-binding protein [Zeimonas sp.]